MKIARFRYNNIEELGYLINDGIIPFSEIPGLPKYLSYPFTDNLDKISTIEDLNRYRSIPLNKVRLTAPLKYPGKIICLGLNYIDHVKETGAEKPDDIIVFLKPRTALTGPYDEIKIPSYIRKIDYEGELAVVIGKRGRNIDMENAYEYIFGYMIMNDVTSRELQFKDKQWTRSKGIDKATPIGPWIVTREEIDDPHNLRIRTWVNNEIRQDGSTSQMIFKIPDIVSRISMYMTLEPGDIISTGTPSGVGISQKSGGKLIKDGDVVKIEIEGIGSIENKFRFI